MPGVYDFAAQSLAGEEVPLKRFEGHANAVIRVAFVPGGKHVVSASSQYRTADRILRLWDLESGQEVQSVSTAEEASVGCVALTADSRGAFSGGAGGNIRLWRLPK